MSEETWELVKKAIFRACEKMEPGLANMVEDALLKEKEERKKRKKNVDEEIPQ